MGTLSRIGARPRTTGSIISRFPLRAGVLACHDRIVLSSDTYIDTLRRDATAFADLLREVDLSAPVPDCPGWTVAVGRATSEAFTAGRTVLSRPGHPATSPSDPPCASSSSTGSTRAQPS